MAYSLAATARQCHGATRGQFIAVERKSLANRDAVTRRMAQMVKNVQGESYTARKARESLVFHVVALHKPAGKRYQRIAYGDVASRLSAG